MEEQGIRKTPLYERHVENGGRMVPFAGYALPVQYSAGVITEHKAVREAVGLFDVSHMGEVLFEGRNALANLQNLLCNDFTSLQAGRVRYSPMLNIQGGVVDDVLVYCLGEDKYLVVVNAANRVKDLQHMMTHRTGEVAITDLSEDYCQLALQGPHAEAMLRTLAEVPQKYYSFLPEVGIGGIQCLVSRTGYTGEDGFELYANARDAKMLFDTLVTAGEPFGLQLCGLGCRDTLRMEAAMPLYGHEMDDTISPMETGLHPFVKLEKPDFIGKTALVSAGPPGRTRIGLRMVGRGIAREHFPIMDLGRQVGYVTSGTFIPTQNAAVAMALVETPYSAAGNRLYVEIRGKGVEAEVVPLPFYNRRKGAGQ